MGNTWSYDLLLPLPSNISSKTIFDIFNLTETHGYSPKHSSGTTVIWSADGLNMMQYADTEMAVKYLVEDCGLVVLWKGEVDISLTFDHFGFGEKRTIESLTPQDTFRFGKISIGIGHFYFLEREPDRVAAAQDVYGLFVDLCRKLRPIYVYSSDEIVFEHYMQELRIHNDVQERKVSSILFWLNYFDQSYFSQIGAEVFDKMTCKVTAVEEGRFVSLYQYPWEVNLESFQKFNEEWKSLIRDLP